MRIEANVPHTSFPESMGGGKAAATELPTVASAATDERGKSDPIKDLRTAVETMDWESGMQVATRPSRVALASVGRFVGENK